MKIDGALGSLGQAEIGAVEAEKIGYDGAWSFEVNGRDPFLPLVTAAEHTSRIELGTGIAVAFGRSPLTVAQIANDLQTYSEGRFVLGLGSQIKPHITKRYSMPWSKPAARMREYVQALRAIWDSWNNGTKLDFRGEFYTHTLMTPFFMPKPNPYGAPKVFLAAVGSLMTQVAGEVCDGMLCHSFTTEEYFQQITLPAIEEGLSRAGRSRDDFEISGPAFIVTGTTEKEMADAARGVREQIAFYGSTPAYKPVLELHGWEDLHLDLNRMSKAGQWEEMGDLIDDEILNAFAVVAEPEVVAKKWAKRWGGLVDRLAYYAPYESDPDRWHQVLADLRSA